MRKRRFIFLLLVLSCATLVQAQQRPNILFLLADDMSYPYAGVYGDTVVKTPNIDEIARHGVVFSNAFSSAPSCTPSRAAILTGRYPHNLGEGVSLVGKLDVSIPTYVKILREKGYEVGFNRKGWGPGDYTQSGYAENPCGTEIELNKMLADIPKDKPFFFWFGTHDPHRFFPLGGGALNGIDPQKIKVPGFLPDLPEIKGDLADYFALIERFDKETGDLLAVLKKAGRLENTIIVVTGDNGMPFPHAKANLYDQGTRVPLVIGSFGGQVKKASSESFVNLLDLMPTFLDIAGVKDQPKTDGTSLMPIMTGEQSMLKSEVFLERERHCLARVDSGMYTGYPMRAVRTKDYLYIRNFRPTRNPAGDESIAGTPSLYGDIDGGPSKALLIDNKDNPKVKYYFDLATAKRPAEELYLIKEDPDNLHNVAGDSHYAKIKDELSAKLGNWMKATNDPRLNGGGNEIDRYKPTTYAWITKWGIEFVDSLQTPQP